jgi:membrane-associated phospholipid phosphatase
VWLLCAAIASASAQVAPATHATVPAGASHVHGRDAWVASSVALAGALVFDERLRSVALANHSRTLDRLASGADVLGTAGHIVPALAATYVGARVLRRRSFADATLRVAVAYATADVIESLLKPAVGRIRPDVGREPLTFRPFSTGGDFESFPSAHVVHIASLASAISMEADRPWVTVLASVAVTNVGVQRVYRDQHWTSDVVASGMLGVEVAKSTIGLLRQRSRRS